MSEFRNGNEVGGPTIKLRHDDVEIASIVKHNGMGSIPSTLVPCLMLGVWTIAPIVYVERTPKRPSSRRSSHCMLNDRCMPWINRPASAVGTQSHARVLYV